VTLACANLDPLTAARAIVGYRPGVFTQAIAARFGVFEAADRGTLAAPRKHQREEYKG
jgi:transcriptional regulator with GAF, ATPase, and Fis domain